MWRFEVKHEGLKKARVVTGTNYNVVVSRAAAQKAIWDALWQAHEKTGDAIDTIESLRTLLRRACEDPHIAKWASLKDTSKFTKPQPERQPPLEFSAPPKITDRTPAYGFLDILFPSRKERKDNQARSLFEHDYREWKKEKDEIVAQNNKAEALYREELKEWEGEKRIFEEKQAEFNQSIDAREKEYLSKDPEAITEYCDLVLSSCDRPAFFPHDFEIEFNPANGILIIDYLLPSLTDIPRVKEVRFVKARHQLVKTYLSDAALNKLFDDIIYQIALRAIHDVFRSDVTKTIGSVVFNGWVDSVDKATGQKIKPCILSIQTLREEFMKINLSEVDPKLCFKNLKGVSSSKLSSLTPIPPILNINREDKRFVSAHDVVEHVDESTNLAAMDWEDFEHLIRELFEKEFSNNGGEVKITRASRDSGVDAVAFDPDPIRGGKIVIQAKRYTNTVSVSAVRDLYGTVLNEGATKGILVTTTDYGPDAYDFAKGKPLTLLNGGNLLHLLEKHGHRAVIDVRAAKQFMSEKGKNGLP